MTGMEIRMEYGLVQIEGLYVAYGTKYKVPILGADSPSGM